MALATKCPYCSTVFRVAYDQLKLRGGIVRCGYCQQVFDGNAGLQDPTAAQHAPAAPELAPAESVIAGFLIAKSAEAPPSEPVVAVSASADVAPIHAPADVDSSVSAPADAAPIPAPPPPSLAPLDTAQPDAAPAPLPPMRADLEPDFDLDLDFDLDAEPPASEFGSDAASASLSKAAPEHHWIDLDALTAADGARLQREAMLAESLAPASAPERSDAESAAESAAEFATEFATEPAAAAADADADDGAEPAFVMRSRRNQRHGKTMGMLMGLGSCALLLALLAQGVMTFGSQLAAQAPSLKPALTTLCRALGCRIALPMQIKSLSIELGELQTLSASTFSYATVLHNNSGTVQAWPNLELILSDGADKALLRRVFVPRDYLGRPPDATQDVSAGFAAGFAARSEQAVKLTFELAQINASGYHIAVFYP